jgi:hypothetical protein
MSTEKNSLGRNESLAPISITFSRPILPKYTTMKLFDFYWLSENHKILTEARSDSKFIFDVKSNAIVCSKTLVIYKKCTNEVYVKLNCACNSIKCITYICESIDISWIIYNFLNFLESNL